MKKLFYIAIIAIIGLSFQKASAAYLTPSMTKIEYNKIKTYLIDKISLKQKITFNEVRQWIAIANYEGKKCGKFTLRNVKGSFSIIDRINTLMKNRKCSE